MQLRGNTVPFEREQYPLASTRPARTHVLHTLAVHLATGLPAGPHIASGCESRNAISIPLARQGSGARQKQQARHQMVQIRWAPFIRHTVAETDRAIVSESTGSTVESEGLRSPPSVHLRAPLLQTCGRYPRGRFPPSLPRRRRCPGCLPATRLRPTDCAFVGHRGSAVKEPGPTPSEACDA